jgi:hypothetical protein
MFLVSLAPIIRNAYNCIYSIKVKSDSIITNFFASLDFISPLIHSQCHDDAIQFALSNTFDLVPYVLLLPKLYYFELSPSSTVS